MGTPKAKPPVKLIIGFISAHDAALAKAETLLVRKFGPLDFQSDESLFSHTDYYREELGSGLKRTFISFRRLIMPQDLASIKWATNAIEKKFSRQGLRTINIDPGYLDLGKLVLASTKDYTHRIFVGRGIFAESTLYYKDKTFQAWPWTYPDYRTREYIALFNAIRTLYAQQIKRT